MSPASPFLLLVLMLVSIGTAHYKIIRDLCGYELILSLPFYIQLERPTDVNMMTPLALAAPKRVVPLKSYYRRETPLVTRKLLDTVGLLAIHY